MNLYQKQEIVAYWLWEISGFISYLSDAQEELVKIVHPEYFTPEEPNEDSNKWTDADHRSLVYSNGKFISIFEDMICDEAKWQWVENMETTGNRTVDVCNMLIRIGETISSLNFYQRELLHFLTQGQTFNSFETQEIFKYQFTADKLLSHWFQSLGEPGVNDLDMLCAAVKPEYLPYFQLRYENQ